ncbi:MAG: hypothetical protein J0M21_00130 [Xanthomonadales bacterium]|nr:hypothetical protein [Xanthomonadales bacterium]
MGRYLTPNGGSAGGGARRQRHVITANTPALAVPAWAKAMRVHGVGAGGGGSVAFETVGAVNAGGCGGIAAGAVLPLIGVASIAIAIGAGGIGKAAGSTGAGGQGGNTTITAGPLTMVLEGANGGIQGRAYIGSIPPQGGYVANGQAIAGLAPGYANADSVDGASSPFGSGGAGVTGAVGNGSNATGYGSGGGGSHGGKGGDGAPGLVILEFLEAA